MYDHGAPRRLELGHAPSTQLALARVQPLLERLRTPLRARLPQLHLCHRVGHRARIDRVLRGHIAQVLQLGAQHGGLALRHGQRLVVRDPLEVTVLALADRQRRHEHVALRLGPPPGRLVTGARAVGCSGGLGRLGLSLLRSPQRSARAQDEAPLAPLQHQHFLLGRVTLGHAQQSLLPVQLGLFALKRYELVSLLEHNRALGTHRLQIILPLALGEGETALPA